MKKLMYLALAFIAIATGFTACQQKNVSLQMQNDGISFDSVAPFFYKAVFDDYNFNDCRDSINKYVKDGKAVFLFGGCTEVRYDTLVGRNLDWYVNNQASAVIWVKREENVKNDSVAIILSDRNTRYGSVAMVGANPIFTTDILHKNSFSDVLKLLPFATTDGINEKGVYIGVNVAPAGETSKNPDKWKPDVWGFGAAYTQKEKLKEQKKDTTENAMCVTYLTRIILDHATSVHDALTIIDTLNWFEPKVIENNGKEKCYAFHWLICDKDSSVVVEFIDNKAVYQATGNSKELGLGSVMTNFSNCIYKSGYNETIQHMGSGYERFVNIVNYFKEHANYDNYSMEDIMHKVHFSNFYTDYYRDYKDNLEAYPFKSEFADPDTIPANMLYPKYKLGPGSYYNMVFKVRMERLCNNWQEPSKLRESHNDSTYWYSTHTSIYNLKKQSFKVLIHEGMDELDYDKKDLNKLYYDASLDDPGNVKRVKNQ